VANVQVNHDMPVQAQRGGGGIAPTHLQTGDKRWVVSTILRLLYPRQRPDIHCTGGWVCLGAALDGTENLPPGIRSSDRPARSESLYRLSYSDRPKISIIYGINIILWKSEFNGLNMTPTPRNSRRTTKLVPQQVLLLFKQLVYV